MPNFSVRNSGGTGTNEKPRMCGPTQKCTSDTINVWAPRAIPGFSLVLEGKFWKRIPDEKIPPPERILGPRLPLRRASSAGPQLLLGGSSSTSSVSPPPASTPDGSASTRISFARINARSPPPASTSDLLRPPLHSSDNYTRRAGSTLPASTPPTLISLPLGRLFPAKIRQIPLPSWDYFLSWDPHV
ncbi:hypothetical protein KSP39_PZI004336 [Platanthera zijinensis]|uniref:Uncharacterized protein n=1 Tax=Platanthera zijinensis TaxID=2320716 RepID=A0AAP0BYH7_9ASPA